MSGNLASDWPWVAVAIPTFLGFGWGVLQVQGDAQRRGLRHRLVLLLVILTWPVGVALYWLAGRGDSLGRPAEGEQ